MADTAELTLILSARNLADAAFDKIKTKMNSVVTTAGQVARDVAGAFKNIGRRIANQFGNLVQDILSGSSIEQSLFIIGTTAAGAMVEGLMAHFIPGLLAKLAATSTFAPIIASLTVSGITLGSVLSAAIAIGMAALPFVLLAVAVGALIYLISNPEVLQKVRAFARSIVDGIIKWMADLGKKMADLLVAGWNLVIEAAKAFVASLGDKVASVIRGAVAAVRGLIQWIKDALAWLARLGGSTAGQTGADYVAHLRGYAEGGTTQPGWAMVGEKGPELVRFSGGQQVSTAAQTAGMMAAAR